MEETKKGKRVAPAVHNQWHGALIEEVAGGAVRCALARLLLRAHPRYDLVRARVPESNILHLHIPPFDNLPVAEDMRLAARALPPLLSSPPPRRRRPMHLVVHCAGPCVRVVVLEVRQRHVGQAVAIRIAVRISVIEQDKLLLYDAHLRGGGKGPQRELWQGRRDDAVCYRRTAVGAQTGAGCWRCWAAAGKERLTAGVGGGGGGGRRTLWRTRDSHKRPCRAGRPMGW